MTLTEFVKNNNIPVAWLAQMTGFKRTQVSNWVHGIQAVPPDKLRLIEQSIKKIGGEYKHISFDDANSSNKHQSTIDTAEVITPYTASDIEDFMTLTGLNSDELLYWLVEFSRMNIYPLSNVTHLYAIGILDVEKMKNLTN
jgi:hypothetical protein